MAQTHRVVIVGGGFGGLHCAKALRKAPAAVTLVDRRNFHLFQPLLYQVATGGLSPANIAAPLRAVLEQHSHTEVLLGEVCGFDLNGRRVLLKDGELKYDSLVVAAGSETSYFGNDGWEATAPGLKTVEEATNIRHRILFAFERAERETEPAKVKELLTFLIVGGGPTGVEMAGAVSELSRHTLKGQFRHIDPALASVILIDGGPRVLAAFPPAVSAKAQQQLEELGVIVRLNSIVSDVRPDGVTVRMGNDSEDICGATIIWAAGVRSSSLAQAIADAANLKTDKQGRVPVGLDLSLAGHPEVFVIGDMAAALDKPNGKPLAGLAPVAMQQGRYVANVIRDRLVGQPVAPFSYFDKGTMATIGRARAVAMVGKYHFSGFIAWLAWLFIHLMFLVEFQNRFMVLFQWGWNYLTWNRSARLITGDAQHDVREPLPEPLPASRIDG